MAALQKEIHSCDAEIKQLEKSKDRCAKAIKEDSLEARKLENKLTQWEKDIKDAARALTVMVKQNPWIETDKHLFGVAGGDYDFTEYAADVKKSRQTLAALRQEQVRLSYMQYIYIYIHVCTGEVV